MVWNTILGALAFLSLALTLWQFVVARRFPLHQPLGKTSHAPPVTLLKPLKDSDGETFECLKSWMRQHYSGPVQILFGVASTDDPAVEVVRRLIASHPGQDAKLLVCNESPGANAKVSTLIQLQRSARHDVIVVSDADVCAPPHLLANIVEPLHDPRIGLVNCFYRLANPVNAAMHWEAIAINADFWSQVLQSQSLKPLDFALGAVMATTRRRLDEIGGFTTLADHLADDYQLGRSIAEKGGRILLSPVVVDSRESPRSWSQIWAHQLRWARTIRVCQPAPFFFSILNNATLWPLIWLAASAAWMPAISLAGEPRLPLVLWGTAGCLGVRMIVALDLQRRFTLSTRHCLFFWLVPVKDLLSAVIWALSFFGSAVEWRGRRFRVLRGGKLVKIV